MPSNPPTSSISSSPSNDTVSVPFGSVQPLISVLVNGLSSLVLLDSGALESYINTELAFKFADDIRPQPSPIELRMFDGSATSKGAITHYIDCQVSLSPSSSPISSRLSITKIAGADLVLGSRWMYENQVVLDLAQSELRLSSLTPRPRLESSESVEDTIDTSSSTLPLSSSLLPCPSSSTTPVLDSSPIIAVKRSRPRASRPIPRWPNNILLPRNRWNDPVKPVCDVYSVKELVEDEVLPNSATVEDFDPNLPEFSPDYDIDPDVAAKVPPHYHEFLDLFNPIIADQLPVHRSYDLNIQLIPDAKLSTAKLYPISQEHKQAMLQQLDKELKAGRIVPSNSFYGSPTFMVPKSNNRFRMVVDYRNLNSVTIPDVYPLPLINSLMEDLATGKFFTLVDIIGAYQGLRMAEGAEKLTAFRTPYGMFESKVVRDGLKNAPAGYQHWLNEVLRPLLGKGVLLYIDDIIMWASTLDELRRITLQVFALLRNARLFLSASKCRFEQQQLKFLGFRVSGNGISTDMDKVDGIVSFPAPTHLRKLALSSVWLATIDDSSLASLVSSLPSPVLLENILLSPGVLNSKPPFVMVVPGLGSARRVARSGDGSNCHGRYSTLAYLLV